MSEFATLSTKVTALKPQMETTQKEIKNMWREIKQSSPANTQGLLNMLLKFIETWFNIYRSQ